MFFRLLMPRVTSARARMRDRMGNNNASRNSRVARTITTSIKVTPERRAVLRSMGPSSRRKNVEQSRPYAGATGKSRKLVIDVRGVALRSIYALRGPAQFALRNGAERLQP